MTLTTLQFQDLLREKEGHHLEFKEAKEDFSFEKVHRYAVALANEGGGKLILGVADKLPRRVVGTQAFRDPARLENDLRSRIPLRLRAESLDVEGKRVVVVDIPSRPIGVLLEKDGAFLCRRGDAVVPMTQDQIRRVLDEAAPDYSAHPVAGATLDHLDPKAIEEFRKRWIRKSGNAALQGLSQVQLLADAELLADGLPTVAALILLGTWDALGKFLPNAEVIFEWRSQEGSIPYQQREEFREGFLLYFDRLWTLINLRNETYSFQDGFFRNEIPAFGERPVREAILNAVAHRDYRNQGSVFIRQFPKRLQIVSPGSLPPGITPDNILDKQYPRNRRISEAFERCGLVERSGQGFDLMVGEAIRHSKLLPDFKGSDDWQVALALHGEVRDPRFLAFLERIGQEQLASFTPRDLLVLDALRQESRVPEHLKERIPHLLEAGVVERQGGGRGARYFLSRALYSELGRKGTYTRQKGLDHETNKALLLRHLELYGASPISDLCQVLPSLSRRQVRVFMDELKREGRVSLSGVRRGARWYLSGAEDRSLDPVQKGTKDLSKTPLKTRKSD